MFCAFNHNGGHAFTILLKLYLFLLSGQENIFVRKLAILKTINLRNIWIQHFHKFSSLKCGRLQNIWTQHFHKFSSLKCGRLQNIWIQHFHKFSSLKCGRSFSSYYNNLLSSLKNGMEKARDSENIQKILKHMLSILE